MTLFSGSCATLVSSVSDDGVDASVDNSYQARKESGRCVQRGCPNLADEDCLRCSEHRAALNESSRIYQERRRTKSNALCLLCCRRERVKGRSRCAVCLIASGRARKPGVDSSVDNKGDRLSARMIPWENSPTNAGRIRLRGGKRGAPSIDDCDDFDRKILDTGIERYREGVAYLASPEGKALTDADRDAARMAALGQLTLALRAGEEIVERHRYHKRRDAEQAKVRQARERVQDKRLRALARLVSK